MNTWPARALPSGFLKKAFLKKAYLLYEELLDELRVHKHNILYESSTKF